MGSLAETTSTANSLAELQGEISICRLKHRSFKGRTHAMVLEGELQDAGVRFSRPVYPEITYLESGRRVKRWKKVFPRRLLIDSGEMGRDVADKSNRINGFEYVHSLYQSSFKSQLSALETKLAEPAVINAGLVVGARVEVTSPPFKHAQGKIERRLKGNRFTVALELPWVSGGTTPTDLDGAILELIPS